MPGYNVNYYNDGKTPCHTKPAFTEYEIPTVQSIILANILRFMYKFHHFRHYLPPSIADLISPSAPVPGLNYENCTDWLTSYPQGKTRHTISYKGPLFYTKLMPEIREQWIDNPVFVSVNGFKNSTKFFLQKIQSLGDSEQWEGQNTPLYYVPGLRGSNRNLH